MTPKLNTPPGSRTGSTPGRSPVTSNNPAAVPISLYRQLATELQTTRAMVDSLKTENQQLASQNQQLRSELEKVVQSVMRLQQVANSFPSAASPVPVDSGAPAVDPSPVKPVPAPHRVAPPPSEPIAFPLDDEPQLFTEQESQPRRVARSESGTDMGGWSLTLVILLIVVTAFGLGFVLVRPFLPTGR